MIEQAERSLHQLPQQNTEEPAQQDNKDKNQQKAQTIPPEIRFYPGMNLPGEPGIVSRGHDQANNYPGQTQDLPDQTFDQTQDKGQP
jgi:hypothetical protein